LRFTIKKITLISVITILIIIFTILYLIASSIETYSIEEARKYVEDFKREVKSNGIYYGSLPLRVSIEEALKKAKNIVKIFAKKLGINVTVLNVTFKFTTSDGIHRFSIRTEHNVIWNIGIEGTMGKVIHLNVYRENESTNVCNFKTINKSFAKQLVKELLLELNYTIINNKDIDIEAINITSVKPPLNAIAISFIFKVYGYREYDPLVSARENLLLLDPCDLSFKGISLNPTILILYEEDILKPIPVKISEDEALKKAIDYLRVCHGINDVYIKEYRVLNKTITWYYVDLDNKLGIDTISLGYFFVIELKGVTVKDRILGVPTSTKEYENKVFVIVDVQTGTPSYYALKIARPEICEKISKS